ncbi:GH92 family glycosyl hydrolase [Marinifilum sp.]|uniref:GH92 family glycosyl hydrolase n=1 Tax=Marinifilum sp. TaxID=2033137 RepID=UPI003BAB8249
MNTLKIYFWTFLMIAGLMMSCSSEKIVKKDNAQYIDPFICTADDHGQTDPAAGIPFGMIKPCPDTDPIAHSGYDYSANEIVGFSHTRFSGVGCRGVGGNIRVLPFIKRDSIPHKLAYRKESEIAKPGYYSVVLDGNIKTELSATGKLAFHKYTFPASNQSGLSIDLASSFAGHISEEHQVDEEGIISGKVESVNVCRLGKYSFYYAFYLDKETKTLTKDGSKLYYSFASKENEIIKAYCAVSIISAEQAIKNLKSEKYLPFEEVKELAYKQWNDLVNIVDVETTNESLKRLFYTHLYHATQSPFLISEEDGSYRGSDGLIYKTGSSPYFHGWSIWDTFRSKLPLLSFLYPERYSEMMNSIGELYKQGKPDWATETEPFVTIRTEHSIVVLLEAHRKGLLSYSLDEIYPFLKKEAEELPFKSPDNVLESSFDLWAMSEIAKDLGYEEDAKEYLSKAMDYRKIWKEKFMVMGENSDIMHGDGLYEGTLWQYRWFVPFDIDGIQDLLGGKEIFENQLDYFFENELFNMGNQPDIQVPYLYAYTNSPWKTHRLVNTLLTEETNNWYGTHKKWEKPLTRKIFADSPKGYIKEMDDDAGTMSAWYVWSAMGFYPVHPGDTEMVITAPQFDKMSIALPNGKLEIETKRASEKSIYIQKVVFNGEELNSCFIDFNQLIKGGRINIELGDQPNKNWGTK